MYNLKLGQPTSQTVAGAIERLRNLMWHEYGDRFVLHIEGDGHVLATYRDGKAIEACTRRGSAGETAGDE